MTLKLRFSLVFMAFIALVLAVYSGSYYYLEEKSAEAQQGAYARLAVEKTASACREATLEGDWISALNHVKLAAAEPAVVLAECLDDEGRARAHSDVSKIGSLAGAPWDGSRAADGGVVERDYAEGGRLLRQLTAPVRLPNRVAGTASLVYDRAALRRQIDARLVRTMERLALVSSAALAVGLAAAFLLAGALTRPIRALVHATEEIRAGHLGYRAPGAEREDELGRLARSFNEMAKALSELEALKEQFIDSITHDLKAPLSVLTGYVDLFLAEPGSFTPLQLQQLKSSEEAAQRLADYINEILDFSKLQSGGYPMQIKPVALAPLAGSIVRSFGSQAAAKNVRLEAFVPEALPSVPADYELLHRVLSNLVSNALRYTPRKGRITLRADAAGGRVKVAVEDTGVGIPPDKLPRVFDKFYQVSPSGGPGQRSGQGLGLTICRQIVELHGGTIGVSSAPGSGTTFYFELPAEGSGLNRAPGASPA